MKLDIVIPNYNGEQTIGKTIKSIYSSNNINKFDLKIYVIDDVSTDGSVNMIKKNYPTVKVVKLEKKSGVARARNIGLIKSKQDWILFIDSDMWFNKSTITELTKNLDADILYPKMVYESGRVFYPVLKEEREYLYISGCFLINRKALNKLDRYFDEFYKAYLEDYDFFIRCENKNLTAKYVESARVTHIDKPEGEFIERYYLEVRNLIYGRKKLGAIGPFSYKNVVKAFFLGLFNFAWFNWYGYDRTLNNWDKFKLLLSGKNRITKKNIFIRKYTFFKALIHGFLKK